MMKNLKLFSLFVVFVILSACGQKTTEIALESNADAAQQVFIYKPSDKTPFFIGVMDTVEVKQGTKWATQYSLSTVAMSNIRVGDRFISQPVFPGGRLKITYDPSSEQQFVIDGDNVAGRMLYLTLEKDKDLYQYEWIRDYSKAPLDTVAEKMYANFRTLADDQIKQFQTLYDERKISKKFLDFVTQDINYYYATVLSKVISSNYYSCQRTGNKMYDGYRELWERIYNEYPINKQALSVSSFSAYANVYVSTYCSSLHEAAEEPRDAAGYWKRAYDRYVSAVDPEVREHLLASFLYKTGLNNKTFDKAYVDLVARFRNDYPQSAYLSYYDGFIAQTADYQEKIKVPFSDKVTFVEGYESMKTLREVLAKFKGDPVFVDFWFSTCGPCCKQFAYNESLHKFLDDNNVRMLFVSVDRPEQTQAWKNAIKYYGLDGAHVQTSQALHEDIYENYGVGEFPTYMIVNKKGEIVESRAKQPSDTTQLYDQIRAKLDLQ